MFYYYNHLMSENNQLLQKGRFVLLARANFSIFVKPVNSFHALRSKSLFYLFKFISQSTVSFP